MITFQKLIFKLYKYWSNLGSHIVNSFDIEVGAATFHPITFFNSLNNKEIFFSYIQLCRRPNDGCFGKSKYKLQKYYQFQVIIRPTDNIQNLYIDSLKYIGIDINNCDLRFIDDNWENPTIGAYGIGWEVWLNGMEITQFTYFQKMANFDCYPVLVEITYGLERICLYLQNVSSIYDIILDKTKYSLLKYSDILRFNNFKNYILDFNILDKKFLFNIINSYKSESLRLLNFDKSYIFLSYELAVKMVYYFNLLDSKNYFSKIERQNYIFIIRNIFNKIANKYLN